MVQTSRDTTNVVLGRKPSESVTLSATHTIIAAANVMIAPVHDFSSRGANANVAARVLNGMRAIERRGASELSRRKQSKIGTGAHRWADLHKTEKARLRFPTKPAH
jgi:hypothetical protein